MVAPLRFGQLYIASSKSSEGLSRHNKAVGSRPERTSGQMLRELTGDETIPDWFDVTAHQAPVALGKLAGNRTLIATNKGQADADEFFQLKTALRAERPIPNPFVANQLLNTNDVAEALLMQRLDEGADVEYVGYDAIV